MSSEGHKVKLGDIVDIFTGYPFKSAEYSENPDDIKLIRGDNIAQGTLRWDGVKRRPIDKAEGLDNFLLKENDVLLAMDRPWIPSGLKFARVYSSDLPCLLVQRVACLRAKSGQDQNFIYSLLSTPAFSEYIQNVTTGTAVPHISVKQIKEFELEKLSLETEKEVGFIHEIFESRIKLLRETNATLEAIAQALFKSWFVDFDPVYANSGSQVPSLPPEIQALFPATFTESPQGPIPEGWEWRDLADVTEILNGFAFKSEDYVSKEDGIFVLRTTNFSDSGFAVKLGKDVHLPESFLESHKKYLCQPFDFHLVMVGASVGHTSLLLPHLLPAFRNQNMWCFREKTGFPSKFFIHEVVKANITDALRSTSGSAREFFRKGDFGARKVLVPNNSVLSIFEEHVSLLKGRLAVNSEKIEYLSEARDTLLPRLISGQLRLPEAQAAIGGIS